MDDQLKFDFCEAAALELEKATKLLWDNLGVNAPSPIHYYTNEYGEGMTVEHIGPYSAHLPPTGCSHEWKEYVGFTARYNYCEKCGEKA